MQFYAGLQAADSEFYILDIEEDNIALEDDEVFTLMLSSPSDIRVRIGGTAGGVAYHATTRVTIQDNDCKHVYPGLFSFQMSHMHHAYYFITLSVHIAT